MNLDESREDRHTLRAVMLSKQALDISKLIQATAIKNNFSNN